MCLVTPTLATPPTGQIGHQAWTHSRVRCRQQWQMAWIQALHPPFPHTMTHSQWADIRFGQGSLPAPLLTLYPRSNWQPAWIRIRRCILVQLSTPPPQITNQPCQLHRRWYSRQPRPGTVWRVMLSFLHFTSALNKSHPSPAPSWPHRASPQTARRARHPVATRLTR